MQAAGPHYLLFSQAAGHALGGEQWRFVLQSVGSAERLAAADAEPGARPSRLELLAVVRGLEAIDQPSRVTLLTRSRYVNRGISRCLGQWRERRWQWECFGKLVPIRDHDLWRRVDRALQIHQVECCAWQWESAEETADSLPEVAPALSPAAVEACEPAMLIVPAKKWNLRESEGRGLGRRLGEWLQALRTAVRRPAFTRAA